MPAMFVGWAMLEMFVGRALPGNRLRYFTSPSPGLAIL